MLKYIIIAVIVVVLIAMLARKISKDSAKDREYISSRGGMQKVYATLVNGILEYQSAKVEEEDGNYICIHGSFTGIADNSGHGEWTIELKHAYNILKVNYTTKIYFNDVVQGNKHWDFPVTTDQQDMLKAVKKKMDEAQAQGIHQ